MPSKLVTCPESAHLEEIEYEETPLGMLVTSCTRFTPPCAVDCRRYCTALLDRRRRSEPDFTEEETTDVGGPRPEWR